MLSIVKVMLATTPRCTPRLLLLPMPRTSIFLCSLRRPTTATIFVVPMSNPTASGACCVIVLYLLLDFYSAHPGVECGPILLLGLRHRMQQSCSNLFPNAYRHSQCCCVLLLVE